MDLQRLRHETALDHERVERLIPLLQPALTLQQYISVLERLYGLVKGWDEWACAHAPHDLRPAVVSRCRSSWLADDLAHFGLPVPLLWAAPELPTPVARAAFLGAMYVMEGSTLGGQYIARHVERSLQLRRGEGNAYFLGHGVRTGALWHDFQVLLRDVAPADEDTLITAARDAFTRFELWMQRSPGESALYGKTLDTERHA